MQIHDLTALFKGFQLSFQNWGKKSEKNSFWGCKDAATGYSIHNLVYTSHTLSLPLSNVQYVFSDQNCLDHAFYCYSCKYSSKTDKEMKKSDSSYENLTEYEVEENGTSPAQTSAPLFFLPQRTPSWTVDQPQLIA